MKGIAAWVQRGIFLIVPVMGVTAWAEGKAGTTAVPFLTMGVGARALGMGEAATTVSTDATALYWNPGSMVRLENQSVTFMHAATVEETSYDYVAYARGQESSAWGVGVQYFSAGDVPGTDNSGNETGSMTPQDLAVTGGYARKIHGYGLGISAKYIQSKLVDTAQTVGVDAGALSPQFWGERLRAGLAVSNLGGRITYDDESVSLPLVVRGGVEAKPWKGWTGAVDAVAPKGEDLYWALGGEYRQAVGKGMSLSIRGGYNGRTSAGGNAEGLSVGLGFGWKKLTVDYAFVSHGDLDPSQVVSIEYAF